MGLQDFRQDVNIVHRYCAARGLGAEIRDYLLGCAKRRAEDYDNLAREGETRFAAVTERRLDEWVEEMPEGPGLGF